MSTLEHIQQQGRHARLIQFDIANGQEARHAQEDNIHRHGVYYGIVNNSGITRDSVFPALSEQDWSTVMHTNLNSFFHMTHPCLMPVIEQRRGGRIITPSSVSGLMGNREQVNYSAAKASIIGASKAVAVELGKRHITVNCIAPGLIDTGMVQMEARALQDALHMIPLKRMGKAAKVARLASYLMSDEAAYITRQVISINGGML